MKDARGITVFQNEYDSTGRVARQIQADGGVFRFLYSYANVTIPERSPILKTTVVDPLDHATTYRFDPQGIVIQATRHQPGIVYAQGDETAGLSTRLKREPGTKRLIGLEGIGDCPICGDVRSGDQYFVYDENGNVLKQTDARGATTAFIYDATFNKLKSITDPENHVTQFTYDSYGNLSSVEDANHHVAAYKYNAFGQPVEVVDAGGSKTIYEYDSYGNLITVRDPLGNETRLRYDAVSRLIEVEDALGRTTKKRL